VSLKCAKFFIGRSNNFKKEQHLESHCAQPFISNPWRCEFYAYRRWNLVSGGKLTRQQINWNDMLPISLETPIDKQW
jgi:hypothetical protein